LHDQYGWETFPLPVREKWNPPPVSGKWNPPPVMIKSFSMG